MQDIAQGTLVGARGLMCPMPVMAATRAMRRLTPGQVLEIMAKGRGSLADIPAWTEENGDEPLDSREDGSSFVFYVRKAPTE
jgi:tRNA 2-thiouridine synthesizing protein A